MGSHWNQWVPIEFVPISILIGFDGIPLNFFYGIQWDFSPGQYNTHDNTHNHYNLHRLSIQYNTHDNMYIDDAESYPGNRCYGNKKWLNAHFWPTDYNISSALYRAMR